MYLGIDPGASGGIALLKTVSMNPTVDGLYRMPATEADVWGLLGPNGVKHPPERFAVIEKVHAMPGNGVSGMFKFGMSYGSLRMALVAAGIPFEEVTPQRWQKVMGITPRDKTETQTQFKNRLKAKAQQLFPGAAITLATCDALLIAEYCRRLRTGRL